MKTTYLRTLGARFLLATPLIALSLGFVLRATSSHAAALAAEPKPTIVLVHGAFAGSSSWNAVAAKLLESGYPVVAAANPLRGLRYDADYVAGIIQNIKGPVVAVGHSYAGSVITDAAAGKANVKALVYVAGFAPEPGESAADLSARFPGGTLGPTLAPPVPLADGGKDLYIQQDKFHAQFAADVPAAEAKLMAATQRPITESGLNDPAATATWKTIPSWFIFGSQDKNIPEAVHAFMAQRAKAKETVDVKGASHVVMVSHPDAVSALIKKAAESVASAPMVKTTAR
ncbi:MAG: alpha/beta hydrolase [Chthoniobacteraceae bacterium]